MMTASKVMTRKVVTVTMDASLGRIREVFEAHGFHHLVVVEHHKPVGVISDRDVLRELSPYIGKMSERNADVATLKRKAHQIMSRQVHTAQVDSDVCDLIRMMLGEKIGCVPIVGGKGELEGIVTWRDILAWCADEIFCVDDYCKVDEDAEEAGGETGPARAA